MYKNIAITDSYLNSVFRLDNQARRLTLSSIKELANNSKSPGLQIHAINRANCDSKFRSARVSQDYRLIFAMLGDTFLLLYLDHHDAAYDWCIGKYLEKTDFGSSYIYDELKSKEILERTTPININATEEEGLLATHGIKVKHLTKIGISEIHGKNLVKIASEDDFLEYIVVFPAEIQEALLDLISGQKSIEEVYNNLVDPDFAPDANPLDHKDSKRRFYIPQSEVELEALMQNDAFEKWQIFLHPAQSDLITRNFNGPVLIEGGPGTGKTIVGIHRAVYLAQNVFTKADQKRILFCTYSKKLSIVIAEKIELLCKQKNVESNIEVIGIDQLFVQQIKKNGIALPYVDMAKFSGILQQAYQSAEIGLSRGVLENEYFEVVEKYNIKTLDEYLKVDRLGMRIPFDTSKRKEVWRYLGDVIEQKSSLGINTFVDRARLVLEKVESGEIPKIYDAIIIDEAQDLEPLKIKAVMSLVKDGKNNAFILSDVNQRIYRLTSWKNEVDVRIAGRTYYLSINYRTTKQINDYAQYQFMLSDIEKKHLREYKSVISGIEPKVIEATNDTEQLKILVEEIKNLLSNGYEPQHICVICNTKEDSSRINGVLSFTGIGSTVLTGDEVPTSDSGINICPVYGVKGLEFEAVIIYDFNNIGKQLVDEHDNSAMRIDFQKLVECEKYVASTRARAELIITFVLES